jgi:hypothetical protein
MLAWVMNMGFAASSAGGPVVSPTSKAHVLGLSLIRLGGTFSLLLIMVMS